MVGDTEVAWVSRSASDHLDTRTQVGYEWKGWSWIWNRDTSDRELLAIGVEVQGLISGARELLLFSPEDCRDTGSGVLTRAEDDTVNGTWKRW